MAGKGTHRSPTVRIDAHRPLRGELLERGPACGSLHRYHTHSRTSSWPLGKDLGRGKWVVARPVQRLWGAGRQGDVAQKAAQDSLDQHRTPFTLVFAIIIGN